MHDASFSKEERICSKPAIANLMENGRWGSCGDLRFRWCGREGGGCNRIMVSVPKRMFKRAVKRNLLKRRIREAYRTQKAIVANDSGIDIMFVYNTREILDYGTIRQMVEGALRHIAKQ